MSTRPPFFVGAGFALFATLLFSINDGLIKFLAGDYALHQVVFIRSVAGIVLLGLIVIPMRGGFHQVRTERLALHVFRGLCVVWANLFFYMALAELKLAEVVGIFFVAPFLISIGSVVFLKEHVGPQRWAAIAIGFIGVMFIVKPGTDAFRAVAILPILAAVGYAAFHLMTRKLAATETIVALTFFPPLTFVIVSSIIGLALGHGAFDQGDGALGFVTRAWVWPNPWDFGIMVLIGVGVTFGGAAISQAYRTSEAALIAPFEYLALIYAAVFGWLFFDEWPDPMAWVGIGIILASGIFMIWREAVNAQARVAPPNSPR